VVEGKAKPFMEIIQARRRQWQHPEDDPFQAADLGGKLLINRTRLRDSLEDLTKTGKTRIVAVKGPKRSGKSHSIYYLEHIERVFGKYQMAIVRLEEDEEPATFDPPLLIEAVLNQLGLDVSRIPTQTVGVTETRWVRRLMDFLVGQIKTTGKTVLVVLDGFSHPNLPSLTRDLVRELVKRAATDSKLRIALLDYSDDLLPIEAAGRFSTESIPNFTRADLCNFFLKFARANGKNPPAATIDIMVDHILKAVPAGDSDRIENVAKEVEKWTLGLKGDA